MRKRLFFLFYLLVSGGLSLLLYPLVMALSSLSIIPKHVRKRFWPEKRPLPAKSRPRIWVHALSLGEMYSAFPLLDELQKYPVELVCTASTRSGMAAVQKAYSGKVADIRFFPLDHPLAVIRTMEDLDPDFFILVETDLWPFFMHRLTEKGIPSLWVNVRISEKTLKGYSRLSFLMKSAINAFTGVMPQGALDLERLKILGLFPEKILPAGNLKLDRKIPDSSRENIADIRDFLGDCTDRFIWICGSLHLEEIEFVAKIFSSKAFGERKTLCLLVPRYPDESPAFLAFLEKEGISASIVSEKEKLDTESVLIIDRMGILADLYSLGNAAFVGGSAAPLRGHNPLEPAMAGIPVMMGTHHEDCLDSFTGLLEEGAARLIKTPEDAMQCLSFWMDNPEKRIESGMAGKNFVEKNKGATGRAVRFVMEHLRPNFNR
ncbi:hypothetical protein LJC24_02220 [Desulfococcaceae bacterium OttesenSCG-928-F15]|nr:hypothetical protein [Desulfococcaceae bacterium OttesenSCG-928-F15]